MSCKIINHQTPVSKYNNILAYIGGFGLMNRCWGGVYWEKGFCSRLGYTQWVITLMENRFGN